MRFESFVALRYLRGKRKNRFISLITLISVAGVAVGVMTLIIVIGVMTGFNIALRETIIGNRAHLSVYDPLDREIPDYEALIEEIRRVVPEVEAAGPFIQFQGLINNAGTGRRISNDSTGAFFMGVEPALEEQVTSLAKNLTTAEGRLHGAGRLPGHKEIVLGYGLAMNLGVHIGDKVSVMTTRTKNRPLFGKLPSGVILTVSGVSDAKMSDFDSLFAWVDIATAQTLTGRDGGVEGVHLRTDDPTKAEGYKQRIREELGYHAETWYDNQRAFFEALRQEKRAMFIILVFIVLVAAFNITSTLIMMVMEKRRDIGILRTIGASSRTVLRLFMLEGLIIGLSGTVAGVLLGTLIAANLNPIAETIAPLFGIELFNQQIYYFDRIPVKVVPNDVATITIAAVILSFLSTLYPAWSASRLDPVDALRHE
jgi:lipoprotein-releasing system permease protein